MGVGGDSADLLLEIGLSADGKRNRVEELGKDASDASLTTAPLSETMADSLSGGEADAILEYSRSVRGLDLARYI